jgi:hypothetical protein
MSSIYTSGYGYSKKLCEDITSWFLNEFYPRHKISVDIVHRGLKRENALGYCDVEGDSYRPRHFLIELQSNMCKESYIKTLLHELTHLAQWVDGSLRFRHGKMCYCQEPVENYDYEYQPHEIEARESEEILYDLYLNEKEGVPVKRVAQQSFSNRLCAL